MNKRQKELGAIRKTDSKGRFVKGHGATHGLHNSKLNYAWRSIKQRCLNPKNPNYGRYGGRGITLSDEWMSFNNFYRDMASGYEPGLTIDRIDNDKGYSKENCRWATQKEQMHNNSRNVWLELNGERMIATDWARKLGISTGTIHRRVALFGVERALTMEKGSRSKYKPRNPSAK